MSQTVQLQAGGLPPAPSRARRGRFQFGFWRALAIRGLALGWVGWSLAIAEAAAPATMQPLLTNGPAANRLNVVFLSEGYTSEELGQFLIDATNSLQVLLTKAPFREYQAYFNAYAISVPSQQSGSDHPNAGLYRDTYFNSSYDSFSDLLITIPPNDVDRTASHGQGKIDALLKQFVPKAGLSVLLVNDLVPGGSDGFDKTAIFSVGRSAFLPHESGHVLAGLGDEYSLEYPGFPNTEEPNTTRETRREFIKWKAWIDAETPLPTPVSFQNAVGLFEGAHYHTTGWYRPKLDCAMNHPDAEFCEICSEALVVAFYKQVRPLDAYAPASLSLTVQAPEPVTFSVTPLRPLTHELAIRWYTNGVAVPGTARLDLSSAALKAGANTVRVVVADPTGLVRTDPNSRLTQTVTWSLNVKAALKPSITLSAPADKARLTNSTVRLTGTAKDTKYGLARVEYQVGEGPFQLAEGTTNWSANLALLPGTNLVRVRSINKVGTASDAVSRTLFRVVTSPLTLTMSGQGSFNPNLTGQWLEIGRSYKLTANPSSGFLFSNWVGGLVWSNPALSFVMTSNLVLQANFVPNPFLRLQGAYNGLFAGTNRTHAGSGALSVSLTGSGAYSGTVQLGSSRLSLSGQFDVAGRAVKLITRPKLSPLEVRLALDLAPDAERLSGTVSDGQWTADLEAVRVAFSKTHPATGFQGKYTLVIEGEEAPAMPQGYGYAALTIDASGAVKAGGYLADGTPFSHSAAISATGVWPAYAPLYSGKGSAWGWLATSNAAGLSWIKLAAPGAKLYPAGFTNDCGAFVYPYTAPDKTSRVLALTNALVVFEGGNLRSPFTNQVTLQANNQFVSTSSNKLTLTATQTSGLFSGTVTPPATTLKIPIQGTLVQGLNGGFGYFLGTNQSGSILLLPAD